jgi:hypothetical protein
MQSVSSELSWYRFVCAGGRTFSITWSGVFILDEENWNEIKFQRQTTEQ